MSLFRSMATRFVAIAKMGEQAGHVEPAWYLTRLAIDLQKNGLAHGVGGLGLRRFRP